MLVVLCATEAIEWDDLEGKVRLYSLHEFDDLIVGPQAKEVAKYLSKPIGKIRAPLAVPAVKATPPLSPRTR
jgi:hypothetical protein